MIKTWDFSDSRDHERKPTVITVVMGSNPTRRPKQELRPVDLSAKSCSSLANWWEGWGGLPADGEMMGIWRFVSIKF